MRRCKHFNRIVWVYESYPEGAMEGDFKNISKEEIQKHLEYLEYRKNFINNLLEQVEEIKNEEM